MNLDIRIPIGGMFSILGLVLVVYGLVTKGSDIYQKHSLGININAWWGAALLVFGAVMLALGLVSKSSAPSTDSPTNPPRMH